MSVFTEILEKYWGYKAFRPLQEEIIQSVCDGNDTLGLLPTGGGKSIIFQVPALYFSGICIVVTPLVALMKDQVDNLKRRNIPAVAVYSGLTSEEMRSAFDQCQFGNAKFLYLSPERLGTDLFIERLKTLNVSLLAIDEAHCISQWGYDFRPSYLKIADVRRFLPNVPVLALTATATPEVADDIQDKLLFTKKNCFKKSFYRKNLIYIVRKIEDKENYLLKIANKQQGTGVVYVRNRKKTRETSDFLQRHGVSADYYHAGLTPEYKDYRQAQWKNGNIRIICATNAFGMGIDKSDVRFVVHIDTPDSLEAYFQEAGRGGRDEKTAYAVLLYNNEDIANLKRNLTNTFPEKSYIKKVYNALCNFYQIPVGSSKGSILDFNLTQFVTNYELNPFQAVSALKILQRNGYIELTDEIFTMSKIKFLVDRQNLYRFQVANAKLDPFIKMILRNFPGIFSNYADIDEKILAQYCQTTPQTIYENLIKLSKQKIINYIPQKRTPYIIFSEERLDDKNLIISKESYDFLKEKYQQRINSVIKYCTNNYKCRSRQLIEYFGETDGQDCGECDVCRANNKQANIKMYDLIFDCVLKTLENNPLEYSDLINSINFGDDVQKETVIKEMAQDNIIALNNDEKYYVV